MLLVTESLTLMAGNSSVPFVRHLVQAVHAGGGLLGDADDLRALAAVPGGVLRQLGLDRGEQLALLLAARVGQHRGVASRPSGRGASAASRRRRRRGSCSGPRPRCPWRRSRRCGACSPSSRFSDSPLHGEHRRAGGGDGRGGVVLGREDVARGPADLGAERLQRLDQHGGLDGHVQRAGDARALERLARWRTPRGSPSGRASRSRRSGSPCGPSRRARGRRMAWSVTGFRTALMRLSPVRR